MERWKIINVIRTFTAIFLSLFLSLIAGNFLFSEILIVKLFGVIFLSIAIIIQIHISLIIYSRDMSILIELKDFEGMLEEIRTDMKNFPSYIESNNSEIDGCIRSNNSEMCKYIDTKISQVIEVIEDQCRK